MNDRGAAIKILMIMEDLKNEHEWSRSSGILGSRV